MCRTHNARSCLAWWKGLLLQLDTVAFGTFLVKYSCLQCLVKFPLVNRSCKPYLIAELPVSSLAYCRRVISVGRAVSKQTTESIVRPQSVYSVLRRYLAQQWLDRVWLAEAFLARWLLMLLRTRVKTVPFVRYKSWFYNPLPWMPAVKC